MSDFVETRNLASIPISKVFDFIRSLGLDPKHGLTMRIDSDAVEYTCLAVDNEGYPIAGTNAIGKVMYRIPIEAL